MSMFTSLSSSCFSLLSIYVAFLVSVYFLFAPFLLSLLCHSIWFYLLYLVAGFVFIAGVFYIDNIHVVYSCV